MSKRFTAADLERAVSECDDSGYSNPWDALAYGEKLDLVAPGIGAIDDYARGGESHDGCTIYVVVKADGRLFRKTGTYSSWDSTFWDGPVQEVEEFERVVTDFRPI